MVTYLFILGKTFRNSNSKHLATNDQTDKTFLSMEMMLSAPASGLCTGILT